MELSNYIGGAAVAATGDTRGSVNDSSTGEELASFTHASLADAESAVAAAVAAQPQWAAVPLDERIAVVNRWADLIEEYGEELAGLEMREVGTPARNVRPLQIGLAVEAIRATTRGAHSAHRVEQAEKAKVVKEPIGVVAAITPWNYPLFQTVLKVAPALVAGCAVVLKPAEITPLAIMRVAELTAEAGLLPGALNVVNGPGRTVGQAIVSHRAVDAVSFTGSFQGGSAVALAAAKNCRPATLELGGKSASIVLDGDLMEAATRFTWASSQQNAGQTCAALTRLIVPSEHIDEVVATVEEELERVVLGSAHDPETTVGPVVSRQQQEGIMKMLEAVEGEGNSFIGRSPLTAERPATGWFVPPAAVLVSNREAQIAREEVFGPVLCVIPYDGEPDALVAAENTDLGLIARVWTRDDAQFARFADAHRVGSVLRNDVTADWSAPFGGVKDSGYGRERGAWGVSEFLIEKAIHE